MSLLATLVIGVATALLAALIGVDHANGIDWIELLIQAVPAKGQYYSWLRYLT